jgi:hypothetical protein
MRLASLYFANPDAFFHLKLANSLSSLRNFLDDAERTNAYSRHNYSTFIESTITLSWMMHSQGGTRKASMRLYLQVERFSDICTADGLSFLVDARRQY